ncbi:MAG TPA: hypothetical protein VES20_18620 [Bryobacteraceae bacterium]|nr:hypothetical protein [Bryobacteraceae bacterium]
MALIYCHPRILAFVLGAGLAISSSSWQRWGMSVVAAVAVPLIGIPGLLFMFLRDVRVSATVTRLGAMSYSLYLCHPIALHAISRTEIAWSYPVSLVVSLALSAVLFRWVELPAHALACRVLERDGNDTKKGEAGSALPPTPAVALQSRAKGDPPQALYPSESSGS